MDGPGVWTASQAVTPTTTNDHNIGLLSLVFCTI